MSGKSATAILRAHVCERHLRAAPAAQCLEADRAPRMTQSAWTESCQLVRGIPATVLALLEVLWCGRDTCERIDRWGYCYECGVRVDRQGSAKKPRCGDAWKLQTVDMDKGERITELQPFAKPLSLKAAAKRAGWEASVAKLAIAAAVEQVIDNMVDRARRAA